VHIQSVDCLMCNVNISACVDSPSLIQTAQIGQLSETVVDVWRRSQPYLDIVPFM